MSASTHCPPVQNVHQIWKRDSQAQFKSAPLMLGRVHRRAAGERRVGARRIRTMGLTPGSARGSRAGHARRGGVAPLRDLPVIGWLVLAGVAALLQPVLREGAWVMVHLRSEEHTSELQSRGHLVCRLLLEKKKD